MSAALTRTRKINHGSNKLTQPAMPDPSGSQEARRVIDVATVAGIDLGSTSEHGMTSLMRAASEGETGTVQTLLDRGANVNAKRSDGFNALTLAAFFGHSRVVWLLLKNGADLTATGRSETPPEMWADARGSLDIGNLIREARATSLAEASSIQKASTAEPSRFPCAVEKEKVERAVPRGTLLDLIAKDDKVPQRTAVRQSLPGLKTLPEIEDPLPLVVPEFHPGSVFVARITSSRKNLAVLVLVLLLAASGICAFSVPQIRKSLSAGIGIVQKTTIPTEPGDTVSEFERNAPGRLETHPAATTDSTTAPTSKDVVVTGGDASLNNQRVEAASQFQTAEVSEEASSGVDAARKSESRDHPVSSTDAGSAGSEPSGNRRQFSAVTSLSRSGRSARQQRRTSVGAVKQENVTEEQPKPAPLSVEASRGRSVVATPAARSANDASGNQPPPSSIISGKPKSRVIQWP